MDLKNKKAAGLFSEDSYIEEKHQIGELFIAKEEDEEYLAEEGEENEELSNWGVYLQGKEKTLLGLFWDQELANLFLDSVKKSNILERMKEIA